MNVIEQVEAAVERLAADVDGLVAACTDPEARDVAELLWHVQKARLVLQQVERDVEVACATAMLGDQVLTPTMRVERHRSSDRKSWDHDAWKRDVRAKVVQACGLKGAQGVVGPDGEVLPPETLWQALERLQGVHGAAAPKTTALRDLGLDARDYCESSPGAWHVRVQLIAEETEEGAA